MDMLHICQLTTVLALSDKFMVRNTPLLRGHCPAEDVSASAELVLLWPRLAAKMSQAQEVGSLPPTLLPPKFASFKLYYLVLVLLEHIYY